LSLERWQSGPIPGVPPLLQPVAHALLQAGDDVAPAGSLTAPQLWANPGGVAAVGWHLFHLAGSTDRLLTYARGEPLTPVQRTRLELERALPEPRPTGTALVEAWTSTIAAALAQLAETAESDLLLPRAIGRARLPTTVLGLLFHAAEHASRHAGQVVTTMKLVEALPLGTD